MYIYKYIYDPSVLPQTISLRYIDKQIQRSLGWDRLLEASGASGNTPSPGRLGWLGVGELGGWVGWVGWVGWLG